MGVFLQIIISLMESIYDINATKSYYDPIHEHIEIPNYCWKIIDTDV